MSTRGLSLVGFMDRQPAMNHLKSGCIPRSTTDSALVAKWRRARQRRGQPMPNAGAPTIRSVPAAGQPYLQNLVQQPWVIATLQGFPGCRFEMVEIDPLLAYQFVVDLDRAETHCHALSRPPTLDELFALSLPTIHPTEQYSRSPFTATSH